DPTVQGSEAFADLQHGIITYTSQVTNRGPDFVPSGDPLSGLPGITLTDVLPAGLTFQSASCPTGWTETDPSTANPNTVPFTFTRGALFSGQSATFTITARLDALPAAPVSNSATIGQFAWDTDASNNSATLTLFNEGLAFTNAVLYHFAAPS